MFNANSSGIESGIKADVSQSISVYLEDDGVKKQSIYSMAFPVTGDLNGQTKVLKVPVVTLQLKFIDKNKKPIPNYEFKTVYRGRTSETKKTNTTGTATVKALAGQLIKVIHQSSGKASSNIVTNGVNGWIYSTDKLIEDSSSSASSTTSSNTSSSTQSSQEPTPTKSSASSDADKGNIIRNDKITQKGPTHEVKTDQAKITIKFLDEATSKPLSGLTYWTQSTKYGKNPSTTGSDGTRGRTHDSDVGIKIAVLINEDGKEINKGNIIANSDKNGVAYVYKAKKPIVPNIKISFSSNTRSDVVTEKTKAILRELAQKYGMKEIVITSSLRTPEKQADAMYTNISKGNRIGYKGPGEQVTLVCEAGIRKGLPKETIIKNMVSKILEYERKGQRVSLHCVSLDTYAKKNIVDLGINSNGLNTKSNQRKFQTICDKAKSEGKISRVLSPLTNSGEAAFHLEIPQ